MVGVQLDTYETDSVVLVPTAYKQYIKLGRSFARHAPSISRDGI
jgi:hypothetical protein